MLLAIKIRIAVVDEEGREEGERAGRRESGKVGGGRLFCRQFGDPKGSLRGKTLGTYFPALGSPILFSCFRHALHVLWDGAKRSLRLL